MSWALRQKVVAAVLCAGLTLAVDARADEEDPGPVSLTLSGTAALPFSDVELEGALLARLLRPPPDRAAAPVARVEHRADGAVLVRVGDQTRVVDVGERTGPAAARIVALVIADLVSARAEPAPAQPPPTAVAWVPPPALEAAPAPVRPTRALRLCVTGGASRGIGTQELPAGDLNVDLVVPIARGRWRWSPGAALVAMPTRNAATFDEVSFVAGVARLLAGRAWGPAEVLAGPFLTGYSVGGATSHAGVLFGAEALARVAAPLSARLRLVVEGRADAYGNRVRVHWIDGNAYATPRLGLVGGLGLAWDWAS